MLTKQLLQLTRSKTEIIHLLSTFIVIIMPLLNVQNTCGQTSAIRYLYHNFLVTNLQHRSMAHILLYRKDINCFQLTI